MASTQAPTDAPAGPQQRLLLFALGQRLFGCEIDAVREIIPFRQCTRLPGAPAYVAGLINLRGTIVTVLDLGLRLLDEPVNRTDGSVVLVEHGTKVAGLGVSELRDVQTLVVEPVNGASDAAGVGGVVRGVARADTGLVTVVDARAIVKQALL